MIRFKMAAGGVSGRVDIEGTMIHGLTDSKFMNLCTEPGVESGPAAITL
jgi:hypothetical protein